jgi:hypothetical protein
MIMFHNHKTAIVLLAVLCTFAGTGLASADGDGASSANPDESLTAWQWMQTVTLPARPGASPYADLVLGPSVFDRARLDLNDLRLYDAHEREIPFRIEVRREEDRQIELRARTFNQVRNADRSAAISLDFGADRVEHNAIEVLVDGNDYRRRLRLEGSSDEKQWGILFDNRYLVRYQVGATLIDVHRFSYPPSRLRYLRVTVFPEAGNEDDKPTISGTAVFRSVKEPGEYLTLPAHLESRQAAPVLGAPGSSWYIDLGGEATWCERLRFEIDEADFARHWELSALQDDLTFRSVAQGEWRRRPGAAKTPLEIELPNEVLTRRLRLEVVDNRNKPLSITAVAYTAPVRRLIFARSGVEGPLRLYFGNPNANAPQYDFARNLPERLAPPPDRCTLGETAEPNPIYRPIPKPWTERFPWAVYAILSAACLVLVGILGVLARDALARADGEAPKEEEVRSA